MIILYTHNFDRNLVENSLIFDIHFLKLSISTSQWDIFVSNFHFYTLKCRIPVYQKKTDRLFCEIGEILKEKFPTNTPPSENYFQNPTNTPPFVKRKPF